MRSVGPPYTPRPACGWSLLLRGADDRCLLPAVVPARLARRENMRFYATCAAAEQAGYRPCQRCRSHEAALAEHHAVAVEKACRRIEHAESAPSLDMLAAAAGMSRYHFHHVFKAITGVTPKAYAVAHRAQRVRMNSPGLTR